MTRTRSAFTLLEVLAAVAVIGIVFTTLARAGILGLRAEGRAERRLAASLLADRILADLEAGLAAGIAPAVGFDEREEEDFRIEVEVAPLDLALPAVEGPDVPAIFEDSPGSPTLLTSPDPRTATPLRRVEIRVAWQAGAAEESVVRQTFAFDGASVSALLASLEPVAPAAPPGSEGALSPEDAALDEAP